MLFRQSLSLSLPPSLPPSPSLSLSLSLQVSALFIPSSSINILYSLCILLGKLDRNQYVKLLVSLYHIYRSLEQALAQHSEHPILRTLYFPKELSRTTALEKDLAYFLGPNWAQHSVLTPSPCTRDYVARIDTAAKERPLLLLAHAYTRYLGDLSGGQMLKKVAARALALPPTNEGLSFYIFEHIQSARAFKEQYRAALDATGLALRSADAVAGEARAAFIMNIRVFQELGAGDKIMDLESTLRSVCGGDGSVGTVGVEGVKRRSAGIEQCPWANFGASAGGRC